MSNSTVSLCHRINIPNAVGCNTHILKRSITNLSEEQKQVLVRRARDTFNKNKEVQLEIVAAMIMGGLVHTDLP